MKGGREGEMNNDVNCDDRDTFGLLGAQMTSLNPRDIE